ncbi:hypothetical protein SADUNF_Sadunf17G0000500 [Salix dunnii]|uniref:Wall-associated receptor kinase galacturonan-binding domain-containing protein n=1 Tax=Salix dunnii TaxID=1413687 RepID=A0A835J4Q9_9ROSI|nr:hypothetical protein SADUNF_Sadunf17G0000500 [Salix dunnii]
MFISRISRHPFGAYAALLLLEILSTHHLWSARKNNNYCTPSSCGNILNISYPFRLNTDPRSCGIKKFELACENNERLTLRLNVVKYYVQAISYSDSTIRLVDAAIQKDDCFSIPYHSLTEEDGTALKSSPSCVNMEGHSYVMVGGHIQDVPDLCRVNLMYTVPKNVRNMSYTDVHDILANGFELSWSIGAYYDTALYSGDLLDMFFEASYCYRFTATPRVLLSFFMLFLPATLIFIVIYHVLLLSSCGLPCLMTLLIYKWRRRHLSIRISRHPFGAYAALLLLQILSTHHLCSARKTNNDCAPSSCGNILNISYAFRLSNDSESCGHKVLELACENNERLTFHLKMVKYYVQAINYSDSTIRLVDAAVQKDDCFSIPHHSLTEEELTFPYFYYDNDRYYYLYKNWTESSVLAFICCENQIQNPPDHIMETSSCKTGSGTAYNSSPSCVNMEGHSYVMVGGLIKDLPDLCRVNLMYIVQKNVRNMSYTDVHDILADGFELSWSAGTSGPYGTYQLDSLSNLGGFLLSLFSIHHPSNFTKLSCVVSRSDTCPYHDISCAIISMWASMSSDFTHL